MQLTLTPRAAQRVQSIMAEKGGDLALRIEVRPNLSGVEWKMSLQPNTAQAILVNGIHVVADKASQTHLDGMVIDWVNTPQGPGFGVFNKSLTHREMPAAAD